MSGANNKNGPKMTQNDPYLHRLDFICSKSSTNRLGNPHISCRRCVEVFFSEFWSQNHGREQFLGVFDLGAKEKIFFFSDISANKNTFH